MFSLFLVEGKEKAGKGSLAKGKRNEKGHTGNKPNTPTGGRGQSKDNSQANKTKAQSKDNSQSNKTKAQSKDKSLQNKAKGQDKEKKSGK